MPSASLLNVPASDPRTATSARQRAFSRSSGGQFRRANDGQLNSVEFYAEGHAKDLRAVNDGQRGHHTHSRQHRQLDLGHHFNEFPHGAACGEDAQRQPTIRLCASPTTPRLGSLRSHLRLLDLGRLDRRTNAQMLGSIFRKLARQALTCAEGSRPD